MRTTLHMPAMLHMGAMLHMRAMLHTVRAFSGHFFLRQWIFFSLSTIKSDKEPLLLTIVTISFKWSQTWTCIEMLNTQNITLLAQVHFDPV